MHWRTLLERIKPEYKGIGRYARVFRNGGSACVGEIFEMNVSSINMFGVC
jgi:hypothetical protein